MESRTPDTGQEVATETSLTALEAAARIGVHERTIRRAISMGKLDASKQGGQFRISSGALERYRAKYGRPATVPTNRSTAKAVASIRTIVQSPPKLLVLDSDHLSRTPLPKPLDSMVGREREMAEVRNCSCDRTSAY